MANQFASPNITVKEIDLSGVVPAVDTSTGAFVGDFNWGPIDQPVLVSNEARLAEQFGSPRLTTKSSIDFLTASYFLKYASTLYVVRAQQSALNAALVGTGTVTSVTLGGTNNNYTTTPTLSFTGGSGSGAAATVKMEIKSITVGDTAGTGYQLDETFEVDLGTGSNATARVTSVTAGGVVSGVALTSGGSFSGTLSAIDEAPTVNRSLAGDGTLTVDVTVGIKSVTMTDLGSGYTGVPTVVQSPTGNATLTAVVASTGTLVKNSADWDYKKSGLTNEQIIAKYAGSVGNSLKISICPANGAGFAGWAYKEEFDGAPGTSNYVQVASGNSNANDEAHVAIIDEDGDISGTPGVVLETFAYVSLAGDAKTTDGTSNYLEDVLNAKSAYVWCSDIAAFSEFGDVASSFTASTSGVQEFSLTGGSDSDTLDEGDVSAGFELFEDPESITVDYLICPGMVTRQQQTTVVNNLVGIAAAKRKDCVVFSSPSRTDVLEQSSITNTANAIEAFSNGVTASNYLILDNNWFKVYDKYKDAYTYIPVSSSTAGLCALTDQVAAPWFSPAGQRRGLYFGVTALGWNAAREYRDQLYKAGVNPVVNLPGQGILLYGDKTKESRPSAFDRINVRRLFLTIERAIKQASENVLFEFNDEFTRSEFVGIVEPFLREIQGRRGITDFRVVCDETNNTAAVIDSNRFVASIFIKPARSINFVTLNFVAVRSGVAFEEVVGVV